MTLRVTVLDMQPIDPPTGGGRLRLLGLYHALGPDLPTLYVGTYDWPGPGFRRQFLSATLEEMLVPLSAAHFAAAEARARACGGRGVIDTTFAALGHLSADFVAAARAAAAAADVVVFSHPWVHKLVADALDPARQLIVYDAHNVEGLLRTELLDDCQGGAAIARQVVADELTLCRAAHLVLACSQTDREAFIRLYGIAPAKTRVVANGTLTRSVAPADPGQRAAARRQFGLDGRPVAFFLGSKYGPNLEAARFIAVRLAHALPELRFVIAGGVGDDLQAAPAANVTRTGLLSEDEKVAWLQAADLAVNPMSGGSGTNIKMLDFMAAGLPIVTTPIGARGIETSAEAFVVAPVAGFADAVRALVAAPDRAARLGAAARDQAERFYSWERISGQTGRLLARHARHRPRPLFSVVVPSYERPERLSRLVHLLAAQRWRDFEVIVIDQSAQAWSERGRSFGIDLVYVHSDVRGAVTARNAGAHLARGRVIAFTDDDCEPHHDWLAAAAAAFADPGIAGLEGLVVSDRANDPDWRPVTNEGFEGIGFMTANLFVRAGVFHALGGFDVSFENPHFREDTDFGWRMQQAGRVPFSRDAWVFHPAHPRSLERESLASRSRFFEKDALLLRKHPDRYVDLFLREAQWEHNPQFWPNFLAGARRYNVRLPAPIRSQMPRP